MKVATGTILAISLICLCVFIVSPAAGDESAATTEPTTLPAKTGAFDITFTQRSPLSEYSKLLERTGASKDELGPDYNLSDGPFAAYVPPDYNGSKLFGLVVQSFQDGSSDIYEPWRPILDAHHLIMVATKNAHLGFGENTGVCLDAVYNLRQSYNIDPSQIYLVGLSKYIEPVGLSTGDVFHGGVYAWWYDYYRGVPNNPPLVKYKPSPEMIRLAQTRVQVLAFYPESGQEWYHKALANALTADGYDHVISTSAAHDEVMTPPWFERVLTLMEPAKPPRPTTMAATDAPAQLLRVAQAYINGGLPERARDKLNLLIQKYPSDPAAAKAREMLDQLNNQ